MTWLARILSVFPVSIDVAGRKSRLALRLGDALISRKRLRKAKLDGVKLDLDPSSLLRLWVYAGRNVERTYSDSSLGAFMKSHLNKGEVFIDIGANIGGYSRLAVNLGCEVHAVEAQPKLSADLKSCEPVFGTVYPIALSDSPGEIEFHISENNPGGSSLVSSQKGWEESGYDRSVRVSASTYDDSFTQGVLSKRKVSLVKIDVEGAEVLVVKGMRKALAQGMIKAIWCEVRGPESDRNPNSCREVIDLLLPFGFYPYTFHPGHEGDAAMIPYLPEQGKIPQYFDLLFLTHGPSRSSDSN